MRNIKHNSIWFWSFILLLSINLTAIGSLLYKSNSNNNFQRGMSTNEFRTHHKKNPLFKKLNLKEEQREYLGKKMQEHRSIMRRHKEDLHEIQNILINEVSSDSPDSLLVEATKEDLLIKHNEMTSEVIRLYEELKKELSEDQMVTVNKFISKKFRQHNRKQHKRFNN